MFCPKCGSILMPKKEGSKTYQICNCGFKSSKLESASIKEEVADKSKEVEVIDNKQDLESLPKIKVECPKCSHQEAYFWTVQTRAGDEPETKFMKCVKCGKVWRDYN